MGVRDRAILLLLARLALRAGDIAALRLGDIDWDRAEIRVSGKSRRQTALPLPQDAGDALHAYIATVAGLRDRAMLHLCYAAGLRVSELTGLTLDSLSGSQLETIRVLGKGRRDRELPLWRETKTVLNEWLDVRPAVNNRYLFLNARGRAMSTDGFAYILKQHVATAAQKVPSIDTKRVTPHVLRHSTAMTILHATDDIRKVSLWLGHADIKTTEAYVRASPAEKLGILETNTPPSIRSGNFPGVKDSLMRVLGGN